MNSEWRETVLGECVSFVSGNTPSKSNAAYWNGDVPWISAKDMKSFWVDDAEDHLTALGVSVASRLVPSGTTLLLTRGMTLHNDIPIVRTRKAATFNQDVKALFPRDGLSADFIPYLLLGNKARIQSLVDSAGHGTGRLGSEQLKGLPLSCPPLVEQAELAAFFAALDDRITLLRETNATLEAIAQALFKSWFVDFDPVRAKQEGRAPEGMDEASAALFPDAFEESELGLVPRGWRVAPLDGIANFLNGLALQKFPPESQDHWLPVIKIAQLRKGDTTGADRASPNIKQEYIVRNGDVLFSWSGSLEVEIWCGGPGALNQHLFKVTSAVFPKWFYFFWTRQHLSHFQQIAASKATTMGHIQRKHLTEAKVILPTDDVMSNANDVFEPLLGQLINNALQAQTLATLRDTLLPRLISGQLRLPDAEATVAESV